MNKPLDGIDFVYGCFLVCGLIILILAFVSIIPVDSNTAVGLGFFVAIPLTMLLLFIMFIAVLSTIFFRRNGQLIILSIITLLLVIELIGEFGPPFLYEASPIIYAIVTFTITISWFFVYRKRISKDT